MTTKKKIEEVVSSAGNGAMVSDPVTTGNPHANRKADAGTAPEPMPTIDAKDGPKSKAEVMTWVLNQLMSGNADDAQAIYAKISASQGSTSGDEANKASIKMKESVESVFEGVELSEEAIDKATTIFEAAVGVKVLEKQAELEEEFEGKLTEAVAEIQEDLETRINTFLDYVAEEWINRNELAVVSALRADMAESFMVGLKGLFENHYVELPEEKVDVVENLTATVEELETKLNESIGYAAELAKQIDTMEIEKVFAEETAGMVDTQKDQLSKLLENVDYSDTEEFRTKLLTIKESTFKTTDTKKKVISEDSLNSGAALQEEEKAPRLDPQMAQYVKAVSRTLLK